MYGGTPKHGVLYAIGCTVVEFDDVMNASWTMNIPAPVISLVTMVTEIHLTHAQSIIGGGMVCTFLVGGQASLTAYI